MKSLNEIKNNLFIGDALEVLSTYPDECIDCIVTSPPYWNLRDYEVDNQLGLEPTPDEYIRKLGNITKEMKRVLRSTGSMWIVIADTYYGSTKRKVKKLMSPRSLTMIPSRLALELLKQDWIIVNKIIWKKPNIMPRPIKRRFNIDYEEIFFCVKGEGYYFQTQYEPFAPNHKVKHKVNIGQKYQNENLIMKEASVKRYYERLENGEIKGRLKRAVWEVSTSCNKSFHKAPYPEKLIEPILAACCPEGGLVLDPFMGTGTTAIVALKQGKYYTGIDLDEKAIEYANTQILKYLKQRTIFAEKD